MDAREFIRQLGYGPEADSFPVRFGQLLVREDRADGDPCLDFVRTVAASDLGICLYTMPYANGTVRDMRGKGSPIWLGAQGNVYADADRRRAAHDWFRMAGGDLPHGMFSLDPDDAGVPPPPVPYYLTPLSAVAVADWYFGSPGLAPERTGNVPYDTSGELARAADGKFVWVESLPSGREFLCRMVRSTELSRTPDCAVACSLTFPYRFDLSDYREPSWDGRTRGSWVARSMPRYVGGRNGT